MLLRAAAAIADTTNRSPCAKTFRNVLCLDVGHDQNKYLENYPRMPSTSLRMNACTQVGRSSCRRPPLRKSHLRRRGPRQQLRHNGVAQRLQRLRNKLLASVVARSLPVGIPVPVLLSRCTKLPWALLLLLLLLLLRCRRRLRRCRRSLPMRRPVLTEGGDAVLRADGDGQGHQVHASAAGQQAEQLLQCHGLPWLLRRRRLHCLRIISVC